MPNPAEWLRLPWSRENYDCLIRLDDVVAVSLDICNPNSRVFVSLRGDACRHQKTESESKARDWYHQITQSLTGAASDPYRTDR